jgi:hypothetical protein
VARAILITAGHVAAEAQLNDSKTARAIWDALPIDAKGESRGDEIRPASAVNVVGRIVGDPTVFKTVRAGARVALRRSS